MTAGRSFGRRPPSSPRHHDYNKLDGMVIQPTQDRHQPQVVSIPLDPLFAHVGREVDELLSCRMRWAASASGSS